MENTQVEKTGNWDNLLYRNCFLFLGIVLKIIRLERQQIPSLELKTESVLFNDEESEATSTRKQIYIVLLKCSATITTMRTASSLLERVSDVLPLAPVTHHFRLQTSH